MREKTNTAKIKAVLSGCTRRDCLQVREDGMRQEEDFDRTASPIGCRFDPPPFRR